MTQKKQSKTRFTVPEPPPVEPGLHHDLDRFAGTWTQEEAEEFEQALREQRRIDPELWQ